MKTSLVKRLKQRYAKRKQRETEFTSPFLEITRQIPILSYYSYYSMGKDTFFLKLVTRRI